MMKALVLFLLVVLLFWTVASSFVLNHEQIHKEIYSQFGISSSVHYGFLGLSAYTVPTSDISPDVQKTVSELEMQTEIVQYPLSVVCLLLAAILAAVIILGVGL